eukprot:c32083_g1_i1 orf=84-245(+)
MTHAVKSFYPPLLQEAKNLSPTHSCIYTPAAQTSKFEQQVCALTWHPHGSNIS